MKRIYSALIFIMSLFLVLCFSSCTMFSKNSKTDTEEKETNTNTSAETIKEKCNHSVVVHQGHAATCTQNGLTNVYECTVCGEKTEQYEILALGHDFVTNNAKAPTCISIGWDSYQSCSRCDYSTYEELPMVSHSFEDGVCIACDEIERYTRDGDTIYFGSYPQRLVTNGDLISVLNERAGALPTSDDLQRWTDYGYENTENDSYMWYIDIEIADRKYRGVYFTEDRTINSSDYQPNEVYWFKYEPIPWTILSTDNNNKAIILCNLTIDNKSKQTQIDFTKYDGDDFYVAEDGFGSVEAPGVGGHGYISGTDIASGNYVYSEIRAWLNDNFYNTAFNELQKEIILTTEVDNSSEIETVDLEHRNTFDKVFLLSNTEYDYYREVFEKLYIRPPTDYAFSQGVSLTGFDSVDSEGNLISEYTFWWLRTEGVTDSIAGMGGLNPGEPRPSKALGVVPAITIQLYN